MKIIVVGSGGREHAIIKALRKNPRVETIYALPGNGGLEGEALPVDIKVTEIERIRDFARQEAVDLVVVGPELPLTLGLVDILAEAGIPAFGPRKNAALIEGSKVLAKELMEKYALPTAPYQVCASPREAYEFIHRHDGLGYVLKADGLAAGKGVIIPKTKEEAIGAVAAIMEERVFGASGERIVMEELLTGPEVTVLTFCDGKTVVPLISSMDHKRILEGDRGLNTGGMGVIAPNPYYTEEIHDYCLREIYLPTVQALRREGRPFQGCLYFGLMLTAAGPQVIEYNCRLGDPEAQAVLPLLKTDLVQIMEAVCQGRLAQVTVEFAPAHSCCLIAASEGYPGEYEIGREISIGDLGEAQVYHSGTSRRDGKLYTAGGRVLGVTATGPDLQAAIEKAYRGMAGIHFEGLYYRRDIGHRALKYREGRKA